MSTVSLSFGIQSCERLPMKKGLLKLCRVMTDFDNVKFSNNSIDLQVLREFCEREGEAVSYRKDITFEAKK